MHIQTFLSGTAANWMAVPSPSVHSHWMFQAQADVSYIALFYTTILLNDCIHRRQKNYKRQVQDICNLSRIPVQLAALGTYSNRTKLGNMEKLDSSLSKIYVRNHKGNVSRTMSLEKRKHLPFLQERIQQIENTSTMLMFDYWNGVPYHIRRK